MPMKKKDEVPQGKNELTITIEKIMQDFGGTKYKAYTTADFLKEVKSYSNLISSPRPRSSFTSTLKDSGMPAVGMLSPFTMAS